MQLILFSGLVLASDSPWVPAEASSAVVAVVGTAGVPAVGTELALGAPVVPSACRRAPLVPLGWPVRLAWGILGLERS